MPGISPKFEVNQMSLIALLGSLYDEGKFAIRKEILTLRIILYTEARSRTRPLMSALRSDQ